MNNKKQYKQNQRRASSPLILQAVLLFNIYLMIGIHNSHHLILF